MMITKKIKIIGLATCITALSACASGPGAPNNLMAQTSATIEQAKSSGASELAPLALRNAETDYKKAEDAMRQESYGEAERLLERAMIESKYAIAKSEAEKAEKASNELDSSLKTLEKEAYN